MLRIGYFTGGTINEKFEQAYGDFRSFCKARKLTCSQPPFKPYHESWLDKRVHFLALVTWIDLWRYERDTQAKVFKKDGSTLFVAKAYNGRIISEWLQRSLCDVLEDPERYLDPEDALPLLSGAMQLGQI